MLIDISEHLPILTLVKKTKHQYNEALEYKTQNLNKKRINEIQNILYTTDWTNEVKYHTNVNSANNAFSDIVLNAINKAAPEHIVHVSAKSRTVELWVTKGIHQSGKKLRQLYKKTIEVNVTDDIIAQYKNIKIL